MPTGVALRDPRAQLFAAAERILLRDGPSALTSRAVTEELGVAKGVLHRHFADFDSFLADFAREGVARVRAIGEDLQPGRGGLTATLAAALTSMFDATTLATIRLLLSRDGLVARLRDTTPHGVPLLAEATRGLADYLAAERAAGRIRADADVRTLALTLVGTGHLLFADELGATPDAAAVEDVVASVVLTAQA